MHHNSAYWSSLAETTLTFPPQLVFLCDEDRKIQRNCLNTLVNITTRIRETNRSDKHFADHLLVSRKGSKPKHKLHLIDELKLKMGKAVVEYFKVIYRMKEDSYIWGKNEALTHRSIKCSKM